MIYHIYSKMYLFERYQYTYYMSIDADSEKEALSKIFPHISQNNGNVNLDNFYAIQGPSVPCFRGEDSSGKPELFVPMTLARQRLIIEKSDKEINSGV